MTRPYPIVRQRALDPAGKRGILGRRTRTADEMLVAEAGHVLVYRVDGTYIVDNAVRDKRHEEVVKATHVSVVDVSHEMPVHVELKIPSADANEFTVVVTFACTVTDPATVVQDGVLDLRNTLTTYLRGHHRIFELGQEFPLSRVNEVRSRVNAQIRAYEMVTPMLKPGMRIMVAAVEVLTPENIAEFERQRLEQNQQTALQSEQIQNGHILNVNRTRNQFDLAEMTELHQQDSEYRQHQQKFLIEAHAQRQQQKLAGERGEFERSEQRAVVDNVGADPIRALALAYAAGEISPADFAAKMREYTENDRDLERQERRLQLQQEREDKQRELEYLHVERERIRDEDRIEAKAARIEREKQLQWERELQRRNIEENREDNRTILTGLIERGAFDNLAIDPEKLERFVHGVLEEPRQSVAAAPDEAKLVLEHSAPQADMDVREEDVS